MKNLLKILPIKDSRLQHKVLDKVNFPLTQQTENQIDLLIDTLRYDQGVYKNHSIALAAPQAGITKRIIVMGNFLHHKNPLKQIEIIINPEIITYSNETDIQEEGCLSIPRYLAMVKRPTQIKVNYFNYQGYQIIKEMYGIQARIFQHEYDHLEGQNMLTKAIEIKENPLWKPFVQKLEKNNKLDILKKDPLYEELNTQKMSQLNK
ncbi:Peptide deformylase [Pseudocohnilembus persalinus]|uniref:Peptide deformylase n=1 Tax=Pseudocohnilembus persalinus TaxID=266149 RepID=A0A0V0QZJ0_PSEPJ|nr:Peptide deformylase [Pseudocohnilembus persalinus]|eukprot:KRX07698.1 Peptide deformylase [Pseudocohnilembus persalinus]